jgi:hypothetical protein
LQSKSPDQWSEQAKLPIHLSRSTGGVSNTQLKAWTPKFHELCEDLQQRPEVAEKDGSYFLRGPFIEGQSIRADANIEYGSVIVLDGDSSFDPETGEVSEGAPSPESVHQVLVELGISHVIYSSHSNGQPGKGHRFRVLLPAHCKDAGELKGYHRWIFHRLNEHGCWLVDVKENGAWSQPWYFPRRANNDSEYQFFCHDSGKPFDTTAALEWLKAEEPFTPETLDKATNGCQPRDPDSAFSQFNVKHGNPKAMLELLKRHGYLLKNISQINDEISYRLLSPHSKSGNAGIVLFSGDEGTWRVYVVAQ